MTTGEKGTACQSVAGLTQTDRQPFTLIFTSRAKLESPVNLTVSLDCGKEHAESTQKVLKAQDLCPVRQQ